MSHRMQITLADHHYDVLVVESGQSGASIAELIRQSIDARYGLGSMGDRSQRFRAALHDAAGVWRDRTDDGVSYQQKVRASLAARPTAR